ncbi:hypothetical protein B0H11DRAFT_239431 [Mycena galericulata]|nr:hypothetical protein B0H11DRAFT_239431 [Mycena galericulata]
MRFPIVTAEDPLTFLKPRDPGCLWPPLLESVLAGRTKRQSQEEEMIRTYMSPGIVPLSHPYMWLDYSLPGRSDPARLLCGLEPSELSASDASKSGKGSRSKKSSARSSTAPSPAFPPSSLSLSACPTSLDVPTSSGPRVGTIPHLHISGRISLGDIAQVFKGALDGVPVVFKSYPTPQASDYLACEVAAYTRLRDEAVHVVPRLLGVYRLPGESWSGLLLEDVGSALGHAFWDDVALTVGEKQEIYEAIRAIHEAGVLHGDVEPRNIARASGGGPLRVIDFGSASMGHGCPGRGCRELRGLREALRMEDVREEDGAA